MIIDINVLVKQLVINNTNNANTQNLKMMK